MTPPRPPNILLITADDMGGNTPGSFGGRHDVTPNLDRLAAEGMTFGRAHVPAAVCQPCRSAIMTGLWPHRNGAEGFEPIDPGVPVITRRLSSAGYLVGILGKVEHLQPVDAFGWDMQRGMRELGMGRHPSAYRAATAEFIARAALQDRPWFLMANAHDPHRPFSGSEEEETFFAAEDRATYPPPSKVFGPGDGVQVPGFLPALPGVEREYREYLSSSRRCDDVVGAVLESLTASGGMDDTVVIFLSDNGIAVPFAKANCYLQSSLTPFIVRWPGVTRAGSRDDDAFVSMLDLFPTLCEAAGLSVPDGLDGRTLVRLLREEPDPGRDGVFTVFHETSAKERFEMRCRQDARYGYIWNQWSDGERKYRAENMWGRSWPAMLEAASVDAEVAARTRFYVQRSAEELYDVEQDPDSLVNLAADEAHREALEGSRRQLLEWMATTEDPLREAYREFLGSRKTSAAARGQR